jgi:rsbT co-antagonist protein RsbR
MGSLPRIVRALRLLGVRCLITGIRPEVARQVVELGADLGHVHTHARVSDALVRVLEEKRVLR